MIKTQSIFTRNLFAITLSLSFSLGAVAAESTPIAEFSQCTFKPGKDAGDLAKATTYWQKQMAKIYPEGSSYLAAIYTPIWGDRDGDFVWGGFSPNLNNWAANSAAYMNSKEAKAANDKFDAVADCSPPNTYMIKGLHQGMESKPDDNMAIAEIFSCTLNEGKTMSNVMAAEQAWNAQAAAMKIPTNSWRFTPAWANTQSDLAYMVLHDDLVAFAANTTNWQSQSGTSAIDAGFASVMNCESFVMSSELVSRPTVGWPDQ
ncbi:MAG: hypothetical protein ACI89U_000882 [Gammaproteobacteria bacterium]|jgi:hypothetical protein